MRTIIVLAAGIYISREFFLGMARIKALEKEKAIRKNIERFIRENHPDMLPEELQLEVNNIMKQ